MAERCSGSRRRGATNSTRCVRASGAGLSIDDFGTGASTLSELRTLPVDTVKIDKSFLSRDAGTAIEDFVEALGEVFEHAPWVAKRAATKRPFDTVAALHAAMRALKISAGDEVIVPALDRFRPELVMISAGFDAHYRDPLASIENTQSIDTVIQGGRAWSVAELDSNVATIENQLQAEVSQGA